MSSLLQMTYEKHESELKNQHNFLDNCGKIMRLQQGKEKEYSETSRQ